MDFFAANPAELAAFAAALLATGAVAGVLAGLLGVGGGIVIVPILYNLLPFLGVQESALMHVAIGTSLATIVPTSIVSARAHYKRGSLDLDLIKSWWPAVGAGALIGAWLGSGADARVLTGIFGVVAVLVSLNMATRKDGTFIRDGLPGGIVKQLIGFVLGGISVTMGIGGGTLGVPTLSAFGSRDRDPRHHCVYRVGHRQSRLAAAQHWLRQHDRFRDDRTHDHADGACGRKDRQHH